MTLTCKRRPGSHPTHGATPRKRFSESRVRKRISPIQMNRGRAARVHEAEDAQKTVAMALTAGALLKRATPNQPKPRRAIEIHTPMPSVAKRITKKTIPT